MRINKFVAQATGLSRRAADRIIEEGRVAINRQATSPGDSVGDNDTVELDGQVISAAAEHLTIILNKPPGYVCSRAGQGSRTIYELLPPEYHRLKPAGRLDKESSGLLLLTDDGDLANRLTHPKYAKTKVYEVSLDKPLAALDKTKLEQGVKVDDYISRLQLSAIDNRTWQVSMSQGRNRQIRRSFAALGYTVEALRRDHFGPYSLDGLAAGKYRICYA
ncbi:MAG TPA: pseudouridine synthase [Candidatus Dormibacteraeota bacterium]|nr:pseudouridine synthase [Candidatus Dormibacteraeota bacterium]